jgi:broad specificity phosphatase PhoE
MPAAAFTRIFLIRHARVAEDWRERIYGSLDVPLSSAGEADSRCVAEALRDVPFDGVVSSGLARAEYLAALVRSKRPGGAVLPRIDEAELREIGRGAWAGMGEPEVEAHAPGGWRAFRQSRGALVPPGGESFEELDLRVGAALDDLARRFPGGRVLVVAHRWVLTVAAARTLGLALDRGPYLEVQACGSLVLDWPCTGAAQLDLAPRLVALDPDRELWSHL